MNQVMVDLETLSTDLGATITSIGACVFNPDTGEIGDTFYKTIDLASQNRVVSINTVRWWMNQEKEAQDELFKEGNHLKKVLREFISFLPNKCVIWSNGATFDVMVLENAYSSLGLPRPWEFWNVRDVRTVVAMADGIVGKASIDIKGTAHNSLDDALWQAEYVSKMWMSLRKSALLVKNRRIKK